jgi:hypothetical protein
MITPLPGSPRASAGQAREFSQGAVRGAEPDLVGVGCLPAATLAGSVKILNTRETAMLKLTRLPGCKGILSFLRPSSATDLTSRLGRLFASRRRSSGASNAAGKAPSRLLPLVAGLGLAACLAQEGVSQCATQWLPGDGIPGVNGSVVSMVIRDPDGLAGPMPWRLVVGGSFTIAGNTAVQNIAEWDSESGRWSALGAGLGPVGISVSSLAVLPNGDLVAGGTFTTAGGQAANHIARWDGVNWSPLGSGVGDAAVALAVMPNGDLIAGGAFTTAGGQPANRIARWDGGNWSPLGSGVGNNSIRALAVMPNGNLVACGTFTTAGGAAANRIASWNGSNWTALGSGLNNSGYALAVLSNGDLVAGGSFSQAGGIVARVARWDGTAWSAIGGVGANSVYALTVIPNGDIVASGVISSFNGIARWDGSAWTGFSYGLSNALPGVQTLAVTPTGDLIAGGAFSISGFTPLNNIAAWSGSSWVGLSPGPNQTVGAMLQMPAGGLLAASGGRPGSAAILRLDGAQWSPLATAPDDVTAMALLPQGDLVVGGLFTTVGGMAANRIARWDGTSWLPLGSGLDDRVMALSVLPNGDLVAAGWFLTAGGVPANRIARWDGVAWWPLGSGMDGVVRCLVVLANGDLVAGGGFTTAGGVSANRVARWDGTNWSPFGAGMDGVVFALCSMPDGSLVAGGSFTTAGGTPANQIARWDGLAWGALGSGVGATVDALTALPNGDLIAGGYFTTAGGQPANRVARWDGSVWSAVGSALGFDVWCLCRMTNGDVAAGGSTIGSPSGAPSYFAILTTTCPATANPIPTGCTGLTGPITLTADSLPWTGSTFRSQTIGFAPNAIGASLLGFGSPGIPLSVFTPLSLPGCDLLASADSALLLVPTAGAASWSFAIPNSTFWAGVPLFHQTLQLEDGPLPGQLSLSSSNALALTLGTF